MIRGRRSMSLAVRRPNGGIALRNEPLAPWAQGRLREMPLVRGIIALAETLALGVKALLYSANVALEEEGQEITPAMVAGLLALTLALVVGLFFIAPLLVVGWMDRFIASSLLSNLAEGLLRLGVFLAYLKAIALLPDVRRVFAYHGAEHKAVNAFEAGVPMEVDAVQGHSTAHTRCGTSFLLIVMVVALIVFVLLGRPPLWLRLLSRVALIPVIASLSYEVLRFSAAHTGRRLVRALFAPGLALQALTTRPPDDGQVEVAICALKGALEADGEVPPLLAAGP